MPTLLDAYGNPVDLKRLRHEQAAPGLASVRQVLGGHPSEGLTPQRLARLLKASEAGDAMAYLELAEEMEEKDLHYRAQLQTRKLACAGLELVVEAASDEAADQKAADLVREALALEGLEESLVDTLDALGKGISITEIQWDTQGRRWMPQGLVWRDPRWFQMSPEDGQTPLLLEAGQAVPLAPFKYLVHRPRLKSGLPLRGGLARASAWAYLFANYVLKDWVGFCELFGQPLRVGRYPAGSSDDQVATLERAVSSIGTDAAAVIPEGMTIEFVKHDVTGSSDLYERLLRYLDSRVTLAVLGQTLTSGQTQGGGGSYALGQVHDGVRHDLMRSDARQLAATLRRDLVKPVIDLNLGPQQRYPKVRLKVEEPKDLKTLSEALEKLVPLGLRVEQSVVRDRLGLPDPGPDAEVLAPPQGPMPPRTTAQAAHQAGAAPRDTPAKLASAAMDQSGGTLDELLGPVRKALEEASTLEDLRDRLDRLYPDLDASGFSALMEQAMLLAALAGRFDVLSGK